MKNKFYVSLFIGIGLTVAATPSIAKAAQPTVKKQSSSSAKPAKANAHIVSSKKPEPQASKKAVANTVAKQKLSQAKTQHPSDTKDSKHSKTKAQQSAEAKETKRGKTKAEQLAEAKEAKRGKTKAQQLAEAKEAKRGKTKAQQLAEAKEAKRGKTKAQQLAEAKEAKRGKSKSYDTSSESYGDEEGDASTAIEDTDAQITNNNESINPLTPNADNIPPNTSYGKGNVEDIIAPAKSNTLFFPPTPPLVTPPPELTNKNTAQSANNPFNTAPTTSENQANQAIANNRIHSSINKGEKPYQTIERIDEEETSLPAPTPSANNTLLIPPINNNKRIRSSLAPRNNFIANAANSETTHQVASAHGTIDSSLTESGKKAGLSEDMVIQLADVFAWDIDFANNLQEGDQFTVVYEEAGIGNKGDGNQIIAAQFINRGKTYTAIRYKDKEGITGYYTPDGRSTRKAFLTTPIDFARVSSHFDPHRRHPILNRIRAHKGVDYAARTGTPVKAAGDGVIRSHENRGAYGRMIVIAHGEHYETAYAHLSNFREGLQDGEPVKQGDVIGYVGSSGLATGPHLHYEFRVDGEHRDPEKLDSKQAMRLPNGIWEDFHSKTVPVLTQLNQAKVSTVAVQNQ